MTFINCQHIPLEADAYHGRPELSQSQLKWIPDYPEEFRGYVLEKRWTFRSTPAMELGSGLHAAIEGIKLCSPPAFALTSNGQRRGNAWEDYKATHPWNECMLASDVACINDMLAGARDDPFVAALLDAEGEVEHSLFAIHKETGLLARGRMDKLCRFGDRIIVADWKCSTVDPRDEREVNKHIFNMKYHRQAAWYFDTVAAAYGEPAAFQYVFFRNDVPYNALVWEMNPNALDLGRRQNDEAFAELKRRLAENDWHHPRHGHVNAAILPPYAYKGGLEMNLPASEEFEEFTSFATPIS